jgi:hypothetical protein
MEPLLPEIRTYQLKMVYSAVSDSDRRRILVSSQMTQLLLGKILSAVNSVYATE